MLRDVVERCCSRAAFCTALAYDPPTDQGWFQRAFPQLERLVAQRGAGLSERLANGFEDLFCDPNVRTLVAVGSDQPFVTAARIAEAHAALEDGADLVLGPDVGGGYYLVGLRQARPELFLRIEMSTRGMCTRTLALARELGLRSVLLPEEYDVDLPSDLERLRRDLRIRRTRGESADADYPRHTERALQELFPRDRPNPTDFE